MKYMMMNVLGGPYPDRRLLTGPAHAVAPPAGTEEGGVPETYPFAP